jgi:Ni,Fe-hydrogenase III large subunit
MSRAASIIRRAPTEPVQPWPRHMLTIEAWRTMALSLAEDTSLDLIALWADPARVHAIFVGADGQVLPAAVPVDDGKYPALSPTRPSAAWFERMIRDLWGHQAECGRDLRPWLDHGRWPQHAPLSVHPTPSAGAPEPPEFLSAEGEDLHQIGDGPIHDGIVEPGHFRFHALGETIVRLEVRLGYAHKGQFALMRGKSPRAAARYAARLSGDSAVAHSVAYARAVEAALAVEAPPRAHALRGVMAELERVANHLGDIGTTANEAAFAVLPARFGWHREAMLQAVARAFGHRLMMDCVVPGGVAGDLAPDGAEVILRALDLMDAELPELIRIYDDTSSLVDRMVGTGIIAPDLVARFAAGGFIGRSAGRGFDARRSPGYPPYSDFPLSVPVRSKGDVDARVRIRLDELRASGRLLRHLLALLPDGPLAVELPRTSGEGIGVAEGFRGDIWHWISLDSGLIAAAFLRDPSWLQWPLLEAATDGNIVADFPLINRSFNCSHSGVDL